LEQYPWQFLHHLLPLSPAEVARRETRRADARWPVVRVRNLIRRRPRGWGRRRRWGRWCRRRRRRPRTRVHEEAWVERSSWLGRNIRPRRSVSGVRWLRIEAGIATVAETGRYWWQT